MQHAWKLPRAHGHALILHLLWEYAGFSGSENGKSRFLQSTTKSLVGEVTCDAVRELGAEFGLNPWSGSMFWAAKGGSRVGSHVNSHSIDILVVPWVPKDLVCRTYDFMREVGHMQGLQVPFPHFF